MEDYIHAAHYCRGEATDLLRLRRLRSFDLETGQNLWISFEILAAIRNGTYRRTCAKCIMEDTSPEEKLRRIKPLMKDPHFLEAKSFVWQEIQFTFFEYLSHPFSGFDVAREYGLTGVQLRELAFDSGLLRACITILKCEKDDGDIYFPAWKSVHNFCATILTHLVSPSTRTVRYIVQRNTLGLARSAIEKALEMDLIKVIARRLQSDNVCAIMHSLSVLQKLSHFSEEARDIIMKDHVDVLPLIVMMYKPGYFQRSSAKARDMGFPLHVRYIFWMAIEPEERPLSLGGMSNEKTYEQILLRSTFIQLNAGIILSELTKDKRQYKMRVFEQPHFIKIVLNWIKHPIIRVRQDQYPSWSAGLVLDNLSAHPLIARELLESYDILKILDRLVYCPIFNPLDCYLRIIKNLLTGQGSVAGDLLMKNKRILHCICCYIHCADYYKIRLAAVEIVLLVGRKNPKILDYLHSNGIFTKVSQQYYQFSDSRELKILMGKLAKLCQQSLKKKWQRPSEREFANCYKSGYLKNAEAVASTRIDAQDYVGAIDVLRKPSLCMVNEKSSVGIYSKLGFCYYKTKNYCRAIQFYTIALSFIFIDVEEPLPEEDIIREHYYQVLRERAQVFQAVDRPFEALGDLSVYLDKNPTDIEAKKLYNRVYEEYKQYGDGTVVTVRKCEHCGLEEEGLKRCSQCSAYFCSQSCLKRAWPNHKKTCGKKA